jgi:hypothetical protein
MAQINAQLQVIRRLQTEARSETCYKRYNAKEAKSLLLELADGIDVLLEAVDEYKTRAEDAEAFGEATERELEVANNIIKKVHRIAFEDEGIYIPRSGPYVSRTALEEALMEEDS